MTTTDFILAILSGMGGSAAFTVISTIVRLRWRARRRDKP